MKPRRRHDDVVALGAVAAAGPDGATALMIGKAMLYRRARRVPMDHQERARCRRRAGAARFDHADTRESFRAGAPESGSLGRYYALSAGALNA